MYKKIVIALGFLVMVVTTFGQSNHAPTTCVHGEGAWDPKSSHLTVLFYSKGCDVATGSKAYSWTEADDDDFGRMVSAVTNSQSFATGCLNEITANNRPCSENAKELIMQAIHAARPKRESLCSRHPEWWIVTVTSSGSYGELESCGR
jgi:hypothetical protein